MLSEVSTFTHFVLLHFALVNITCAIFACPGDTNLSPGQIWGKNCFVPVCQGQNNLVPAVYIACP